MRLVVALALVAGVAGCAKKPAVVPHPVTHGVTLGDVTADRVVVWARTARAGVMHVRLSAGDRVVARSGAVAAGDDFAGVIAVDGLEPDTTYDYAVWFDADERVASVPGRAVRGQVRTAPPVAAARAVRFAFSGDLGGQNVCRDADTGYDIFELIRRRQADFFVALGDMIYADNLCHATGRFGNRQLPGDFDAAADIAGFWAHWRYNLDDPAFRRLRAELPIYAVWDDHEVVNDVGPAHDSRSKPPYRAGAHLMPLGLRAFLDYNPVADGAQRLYRRARWGAHLELFLLDNRQYRDSNAAIDSDQQPKSMLGAAQRQWLDAGLADSDATWKVVVSSVPMSIPTGAIPPAAGRDGWANFDQETGFERELLAILRAAHGAGVRKLLWITTDVHFGSLFRYRPLPEDPEFVVYELVVGPLSAMVYPVPDVDDSLHPERLFFYGPDDPAALRWPEARRWMSFGVVEIDADGQLAVEVVNGLGERVYRAELSER